MAWARRVALATGVLAVTGASLWYFLRPPSPGDVAEDIRQIVEEGRLAELWKYVSEDEREANEWTRDSFNALAVSLFPTAQGYPLTVTELDPAAGSDADIPGITKPLVVVTKPAWDIQNERHFLIEPKVERGASPPIQLILSRDMQGVWRTVVVDLLVQLNRTLHPSEPKVRWKLLADSLRAANLKRLVSVRSGQVWTVTAFERAAATGEAPEGQK